MLFFTHVSRRVSFRPLARNGFDSAQGQTQIGQSYASKATEAPNSGTQVFRIYVGAAIGPRLRQDSGTRRAVKTAP